MTNLAFDAGVYQDLIPEQSRETTPADLKSLKTIEVQNSTMEKSRPLPSDTTGENFYRLESKRSVTKDETHSNAVAGWGTKYSTSHFAATPYQSMNKTKFMSPKARIFQEIGKLKKQMYPQVQIYSKQVRNSSQFGETLTRFGLSSQAVSKRSPQ